MAENKPYTFNELAEATFRAREAGDMEAAQWLEAEARRALEASKPENLPASSLDVAVGNPVSRVLLGAASVPAGAVQLGANIGGKLGQALGDAGVISGEQAQNLQMVPEWINKQMAIIENMKKRGMKARDNEGMDVAGLVGAAGVGLTAKAPELAKTMAGRLAQASATGAGYGAAAPVTNESADYFEQKKGDVVGGALLGPAAYAAAAGLAKTGGKVYEVGKKIVDPYLPGGAERAAGRLANEAAGDNREAVIQYLLRQQGYVPGANLTAGQAATKAGSAEFSALQEAMKKRRASDYDAIDQAQKKGRLDYVKSGGASENKIKALEAERQGKTDILYKQVEGSNADVGVMPVALKIAEIYKNNQLRDKISKPMRDVFERLFEDSKTLVNKPGKLKSLSEQLKDMINKRDAGGQNEYDTVALREIKSLLDEQIGRAEPKYAQARELYREKSLPINEAKIMNAMADRLSNPSGKETRDSFLKAIDDQEKLMKEATGFPGYSKLGQTMSPDSVTKIDEVARDLRENIEYERLAKAGAKKVGQMIGQEEAGVVLPGLLNRTATIINAVLRRVEGKASEKTLDQLSEYMKDPKKMAKIMQNATPKQRAALTAALSNRKALLAASAPSTAYAREN